MMFQLEEFYSKKYENSINMKMMYYNYEFPFEEVEQYVHNVIDIPISSFIEFIMSHSFDGIIKTRDIYQFSNFDDCTIRLCERLYETGDPGYSFSEAGELLQNDGEKRKEDAIKKYGENQLKTGESLGLVHSLSSTYYLTSLGMIYIRLEQEEQKRLLTRLVLRDKLVISFIKASDGKVLNAREHLSMIADSTYIRRKSNIKRVLSVLSESDEYDFSNIVERIQFPKC